MFECCKFNEDIAVEVTSATGTCGTCGTCHSVYAADWSTGCLSGKPFWSWEELWKRMHLESEFIVLVTYAQLSHNHTTLILWINQKSDLTSLFVARNDGNWIGNILKQVNFTCNYNLHIYIYTHDIRPIFLGYVRGFALNFYGFIWYHTSSLGSWFSYSTQVYCKQTFFTIINHY